MDILGLIALAKSKGEGSGGTTNYNQLTNKPSINNVTLSGNKTLDALGINAGSIGFNETETYSDGSIGAEISHQKNAISQKAPVIINSASGDIASFPDGADGLQIRKLVAQIEPVQDLHGQDSPYPAGGWKNLLNTVLIAGTPSDTAFSNATKRTFTVGTYIDGLTNNNYFAKRATAVSVAENRVAFTTDARAYGISIPLVGLTPGSQYTVSASITNGRIGLSFYAEDGTWISGSTAVATAYYTATVPTNAYYTLVIFNGSAEDGESIFTNIQLELGSSATSFAPYENICPISGWMGAEINGTGKNLLDKATEERGYISEAGVVTIDGASVHSALIKVKSGCTYTFSGISASGGNKRLHAYTADGTWVSQIAYIAVLANAQYKLTATIPNGIEYVKLSYYAADLNAQFESGSDSTSYDAYKTPESISVTFHDTIYGGQFDAITGKLSKAIGPNQYFKAKLSDSTQKIVNIDGTGYTRYQFYPTVSGTIVGASERSNEKLSSIAPYKYDDSGTTHWYHNIYGTISLFVPDGTDENTEAEFIIPLATAQETQLDPQEMTTLYGTNNIWSSTGDTEVTYPADTKLYIEKLTQPTEDDMTADHVISAGTFFMIGNTLYLATSQIAAGGTITPGTNATQLSLADALNQLNT